MKEELNHGGSEQKIPTTEDIKERLSKKLENLPALDVALVEQSSPGEIKKVIDNRDILSSIAKDIQYLQQAPDKPIERPLEDIEDAKLEELKSYALTLQKIPTQHIEKIGQGQAPQLTEKQNIQYQEYITNGGKLLQMVKEESGKRPKTYWEKFMKLLETDKKPAIKNQMKKPSRRNP